LLKKIRDGESRNVFISDTAILELVMVLKAKGFTIDEMLTLLGALKAIMRKYSIKQVKTLDLDTLVLTLEFMKRGASLFDALLAASAKSLDNTIISDDKIYDRLGITRIPLRK